MQTSDQPVPKGVYAQMRGISPARVSQYISAGQIHGNAIVGEGRKAMIVPRIANEQLGVTLDFDQVLANGKPTASAAPPPGAAAAPASATTDPLTLLINNDQRRAARANADSAEMAAEKQRRDMAADVGRYTLTDEAQVAFRKRLGEIITSLDHSVPDMAKAMATELEFADVRALTVALRLQIRKWRAKEAAKARDAGRDMAAYMADPDQPADAEPQPEPAPDAETVAEAPPQDE